VRGNNATRNENSYYTIVPDSFVVGGSNTSSIKFPENPSWTSPDANISQFPVIISSAEPYSYLPRELVLPYVRQFEGPVGRFYGQYWADCGAKVPPFGVVIDGKTLYLAPADILRQNERMEQDYHGKSIEVCLVGLMDTLPDGPYSLGNMFLNNMVTVFDVGAGEMRFYPRK
jgi:hypothetical protein